MLSLVNKVSFLLFLIVSSDKEILQTLLTQAAYWNFGFWTYSPVCDGSMIELLHKNSKEARWKNLISDSFLKELTL
jgi:hypothetical protein